MAAALVASMIRDRPPGRDALPTIQLAQFLDSWVHSFTQKPPHQQ